MLTALIACVASSSTHVQCMWLGYCTHCMRGIELNACAVGLGYCTHCMRGIEFYACAVERVSALNYRLILIILANLTYYCTMYLVIFNYENVTRTFFLMHNYGRTCATFTRNENDHFVCSILRTYT